MKKIIALFLAAILMLSIVSCGAEKNPAADTSVPVETEAVPTTPAGILAKDFKNRVTENPSISAEDLANAIIGNEIIPFGPAVMPVEPGYLNGFSAEITGFDTGAMFGPMIGSIPFIGYIFTVSGDVDAFVSTLKSNADLRWNICTQADEMVCEAKGNTVFFVMSPASFDEEE